MEDEKLVSINQNSPDVQTNKGDGKSDADVEITKSEGMNNLRKDGNTFSFDVDLNYPSAVRPPASGATTTTRAPSGGATSTSSNPTAANRVASEPVTDNPYAHPDSESGIDSGDDAKQGTNPPELVDDEQKDAAGKMQSDQQQKSDVTPEDPDKNEGEPKENEQEQLPGDKPDSVEQPGLKDQAPGGGQPDNLMKGDIGDVAGGKKPDAPPQLDPEQQQAAAADNAASQQALEQNAQVNAITKQEADIAGAVDDLKMKIFKGKFAWAAKHTPIIGTLINKVEREAGKNVGKMINILNMVIHRLRNAKSVLGAVEAGKSYLAAISVVNAIPILGQIIFIVFVPGVIIAALMGALYPSATSKGAKLIDEIIREIEKVLKELKKYYNSKQSQRGSIIMLNKIKAGLRRNKVNPPPKPS